MSHDGSSAKSYIRHPTEKERLDNLAFASFPEDYLPYAAGPGHRVSAPPPYLLWGEDRRRRTKTRRRKPRCAGALLCAIAVVVIAILAVVAISVYLGVVTNLFRSPVVSLSGRFISSDEFSDELFNSTSSQFLKKAETYQSKVEKAFLSSALEPAFIAARIYAFRPGLLVFFRVYLDRRKLTSQEGETPPAELVKSLISEKVASKPESVYVEENEELLSEELRPQDLPPVSTTSTPTTLQSEPPPSKTPNFEGIGQWHPVPIEDSVSPSFIERPPGGIGTLRSPEESRRNPSLVSLRVLEDSSSKNPPSPGIPSEGVGSVRIIDDSKPGKPQLSGNAREGFGTVRASEEPPLKNSKVPSGFGEGIGSVRLLDRTPQKNPQGATKLQEGVGSVRLLDETPLKVSGISPMPKDGVGSVRLLEKSPQDNSKVPSEHKSKIELGRTGEETPLKNPPTFRSPVERLGNVRILEEPPTLAPSVSLVIRNKSRSDRPRNLMSKLQKDQLNVGVGSVHEIITEENSSTPQRKEHKEISSRLLDINNKKDNNLTNMGLKENAEDSLDKVIEILTSSEKEQTNLKNGITSAQAVDGTTNIPDGDELPVESFTTQLNNVTPEESLQQNLKLSSLESLLFRQTLKSRETTTDMNGDITSTTEKTRYFYSTSGAENDFFPNATLTAIPANETEILEDKASTDKESEMGDVHSSIVNHSQYPSPEPHYHTSENAHNASVKESFEIHTVEGHGFHRPSTITAVNTRISVSNSSTSATTKVTPLTDDYSPEIKEPERKITGSEILLAQNFENGSKSSIDSLEQYVSVGSETFNNTADINEEAWSEDESVNTTTDDTSQQAKVVPQLQSDFISNDIGEESGNEDGRFEDEILRHITTAHPQQTGTVSNVPLCPVGSVFCNASGEGCGVRCDMRKDCSNNEDEQNCTCSDLLRAMGQSQKLCDGIDDCSDGSDEADCSWCPFEDHYRCPGSRTCISLDNVCDGKDDCPGAQDERRCVSLAESSSEASTFEYRSQGFLVVRRQGQWGKLCLDSLIRSPDLDHRIQELGKAVCNALTYRNMSSSVRSQDNARSNDSYYQISTDTVNNKSSSSASSLFEPAPCDKREVLKVQCQSLECGLRPSAAPSQRRRIVGGRSAGGAGAWPWAAALYREGDFQCGAALISDKWLVSAAHCFYSSQGAYWTVRLGVLRRGSELLASGEQVRQIKDIVLHPQYEDVGFINDIALLRMGRSVPFSDFLRPICLPSSPAEDASLWHGRRCSVVGWGKLYEIGHTFPDSLQEVRLPVISSAECLKRSLFLPAYRITPKMFCAGYDRGGRDACLGDSGGPMACQRPADSRWVLLGVTSNGDGCGRPGRPGVYTQVAGYLSWLSETTKKRADFSGKTGSESICNGVRCRLGRCITRSRMCDGKRDCAGGEDEEDC